MYSGLLAQREVPREAPHWAEFIRDYVEQLVGEDVLYRGGLRLYTTLDLDYHQHMQTILQNAEPAIAAWQGTNAALIAVNPKTGEILAFNGSMDFHDPTIDGQVNVLISERQPGSSIKPVVYAAAFERGWSPGTFVVDAPTCWPDWSGPWCPVNFDNAFHGRTTLRSALGNSLNLPAVKTLEFVGVDAAVDLGQRMGITTWGEGTGKTMGLSLTLGGAEVRPMDLAQVYATLANNGRRVPLFGVSRIEDSNGTVLEEHATQVGEQVLDPRAAYLVTDILTDPSAKLFTYGRNTPLVLSRPAASKTGTTDNFRDTWTAGYTPNLAIVVWVGNADGRPMRRVLSSMTAGRIWPVAMEASFETLDLPVEPFVRPQGLVEHQVGGDTAMRPGEPPCRVDLRTAGD